MYRARGASADFVADSSAKGAIVYHDEVARARGASVFDGDTAGSLFDGGASARSAIVFGSGGGARRCAMFFRQDETAREVLAFVAASTARLLLPIEAPACEEFSFLAAATTPRLLHVLPI